MAETKLNHDDIAARDERSFVTLVAARYVVLACALVIYVVSFFMPALTATPQIPEGGWVEGRTILGWKAFLFTFFMWAAPTWFANPLFWFSSILFAMEKYGYATLLASLAVGFACISLFLTVVHLGCGYWMWSGSMLMVAIAASVNYSRAA